MAKIFTKNLARAIYESSKDKKDGELDDVIKKSVNLISKKHLIVKSKEILNYLEKIIDKEEEMIRAKISSRRKIEKSETKEIEDFIKKRYKVKDVILEFIIDEKLLGGIKIEIGDEIIDITLKNKIKKLQNYLINQ